jgi:hypothetical protein
LRRIDLSMFVDTIAQMHMDLRYVNLKSPLLSNFEMFFPPFSNFKFFEVSLAHVNQLVAFMGHTLVFIRDILAFSNLFWRIEASFGTLKLVLAL